MNPQQPTTVTRYIALSAALAILWCVAVAWKLYDNMLLGQLPANRFAILIAHQLMGLVFLVCGWVAYTKMPNRTGALFAFHAVCAAIHWGGTFDASSPLLKTALLVAFFLVSSTLGEALLLHFTLLFPGPWPLASRAATMWALYGPLLPATAVSLGIVALVGQGRDPGGLQGIFALFAFALPNLFGLLALIVLFARRAKAPADERRKLGLTVMAFGNLLAVIPWLVASVAEASGVSLPGGLGADPYVLPFVLMPLSFLYSIRAASKAGD